MNGWMTLLIDLIVALPLTFIDIYFERTGNSGGMQIITIVGFVVVAINALLIASLYFRRCDD
ncbi:MAG: hypothetical protein V4793_29230 [Paraburkholderia tropica]|uniref:Uncharacterized protein n=1 Tax=Paraburkholderia tropica TaxID=92647 RepID=A0AAQ1GME6_9BURK|nr:hypothetical protein [Paraburkholderia tropica]MBB2984249.1 hypothetical protein [Paraburkholderia tropica]MBB3004993.1 hypothetical protein [Paraburkholderia tropica]MBB6323281.1 hypothetical protein [Paraburkholderia tropica]PXX05078.1 hypothetical protein C7400_14445 [Paraburkholderia tropica]PZW70506.1 hypothetical protein C7399_14445 [Paraburkholderia tropica]